MTRDTKSEHLAVGNQKHDFHITCERFKNWLAKQGLPTFKEAALAAYNAYGTSIFLGVFAEGCLKEVCLSFSILRTMPHSKLSSLCGGYTPLVESFLRIGNMEMARNYAIMKGCNEGIFCVMKNIRGKEDVQASMVAGFGCGVVLSLVTGMRGPEIMSVGAIFALYNGGLFKVIIPFLHLLFSRVYGSR
ncbi:putative mitochondrial import inner membrane translocase subunit TIM22 [Helianthus annuus]|nr:putative mitochondrial import inner membrane translocase subunit TIM22 [Helianthus annuus]